MVRFRVTVNSQSSIYLPSPVREELGSRRLELLGDAKAIIIYPEGTNLEQVLRSVEILTLDLRYRCELEKSGANNRVLSGRGRN
jgi:bifunctional DNA-binding transcriptional regulator/antitoxin component of YhaV-PrlF toxin-antitoxin module